MVETVETVLTDYLRGVIKDMGGSQRVLLKKMTHHQTSHPRTWGPCWVNNKLTNKFEKKLILDYPLGILDYPHWVDQSEAASHTIRHVLSLPLFLFPFALDHWTRGWVMSHYHVENLPCLSLVVLDATLADQATYPIPSDKARGTAVWKSLQKKYIISFSCF